MTTLARQKLRCPECRAEFVTHVLTSYGSAGSYTDFCPIYTGAPALFNLVVTCPMCSFTAYMDKFDSLEPGTEGGMGQWEELEEPHEPWGPAKFLKAAETYEKLDASRAVIADLHLKAFWCFHYDDFPDVDQRRLLGKTIFLFQSVYENDEYPPDNAGEYAYLIGELSRRSGRFAEAAEWLDKAVERAREGELAELARRMKKLALEEDASEQRV